MGLDPAATEEGIRAWLNGYGPATNIRLVRESDTQAPVALVATDGTDGQAAFLVSRIQNYWHGGSLLSAPLLLH